MRTGLSWRRADDGGPALRCLARGLAPARTWPSPLLDRKDWLAPLALDLRPWPREDDGKPGAATDQNRARPPAGPGSLAWLPGCQSFTSRVWVQSAGHLRQAGGSLSRNTFRVIPLRPESSRTAWRGCYSSLWVLAFPQLSGQMSRRGNHLPVYSIQRCGEWADMGQWAVSALGHVKSP